MINDIVKYQNIPAVLLCKFFTLGLQSHTLGLIIRNGNTMSYCRFSSDNWKSDVYVYEDVSGGYAIHVASNRRVGFILPLPDFGKVTFEEFMKAYNEQMTALKKLN